MTIFRYNERECIGIYVALIIVLVSVLAVSAPTPVVADEISGTKIGHYHGNPAHNPIWHYDKVVKVWWQPDGHGRDHLWGEFNKWT